MNIDEQLFWQGLEQECPCLYTEATDIRDQYLRINGPIKVPFYSIVKAVCDRYGFDRPDGNEPVIITINRLEMQLRRAIYNA